MKPDSQHLDFLISQYVDGCLDGNNKKSVEQQLLTDPSARKLYEEHREVQDLLDDWGNRIPLINWDEFDQKLAFRLAQENVGSSPYSRFRRWARPVAAAAALFIAAMVGYSVNAMWNHKGPVILKPDGPVAHAPKSRMTIAEVQQTTQPSRLAIGVVEDAVVPTGAPTIKSAVVMTNPSGGEAAAALTESAVTGLGDLTPTQLRVLTTPAGSVAVSVPEPKKNEEQPGVSFP